MATKKVGDLIKEARTNAGLSQEKLAAAIDGLSASELGKAERGEKDLTTEELKAIAKMTGVTQKSLLEAPKNVKTTAAKTSTAKTSTAKTSGKTTSTTTGKTTAAKTAGKTSAAKTSGKTSTTGKTAAKTSSSSTTGTSMKVSTTEKKLVELYREADSETKKKVMNILKGKEEEGGDLLNTLLGGALGEILKK